MPKRLQSLDVFRGLTIALMILVNTPGTWDYIYAPFRHAAWNGVTPTDLVFPFFLFIMGVSISLSMGHLAVSGYSNPLFLKIAKRALILFLIGLFLNVIPNFEFATIRIPGVLQRIALVFLINALLLVSTTRMTQALLGVGILISYWLLLTFVPFNGRVPQILTPDNNLSAYIDQLLLHGHLWQVTNTWDPEGILSTLPAIVSALIGMIMGAYLKRYHFGQRYLWQTTIVGVCMIALALAFHRYFPINKSLWTSTYVLFTSGAAMLSFIALHLCIDTHNYPPMWLRKPFVAFGTNAITAYVLSGVVAVLFYSITIGDQSIQGHLYAWLVSLINDLYLSSLVYAILFTILIYLPILVLYKKKVFIKI
jgi:predicted acyltransferase